MAYALIPQYREATKSTATHTDDRIRLALESATSYINQKCNRSFYSVAGDKEFWLPSIDWIGLPDVHAVTLVSIQKNRGDTPVAITDYTMLPRNDDIYQSIEFDKAYKGTLIVSATWGWPEIPPDIVMCCIIRAQLELIDGPRATRTMTMGEGKEIKMGSDINKDVDGTLMLYERHDATVAAA